MIRYFNRKSKFVADNPDILNDNLGFTINNPGFSPIIQVFQPITEVFVYQKSIFEFDYGSLSAIKRIIGQKLALSVDFPGLFIDIFRQKHMEYLIIGHLACHKSV